MINKLTIFQAFVVRGLGQLMIYQMGIVFYFLFESTIPIVIAILVGFLFGGYGVEIIEKRMRKANEERRKNNAN